MSEDYRRSLTARSTITIGIDEYDAMKSAASGWMPINDDTPVYEEILVCVTYNLDDRNYETKTWVDSQSAEYGWIVYGGRIDIPFPPTHWMYLPKPPVFS